MRSVLSAPRTPPHRACDRWEHKPGVVDLSLGRLADGAQRQRLEAMARGEMEIMPAFFAIHTKLFKVRRAQPRRAVPTAPSAFYRCTVCAHTADPAARCGCAVQVLKGDGLTYAIDLFQRIFRTAGLTLDDDPIELRHACVESAQQLPDPAGR